MTAIVIISLIVFIVASLSIAILAAVKNGVEEASIALKKDFIDEN